MGVKTILVVDDNKDARDLLSGIIKEKGYRALKAASGQAALRIIIKREKQQKIDLVLLDYKMPRMNGMDTLKQIKKIDKRMRVVFLSGEPELRAIKRKGADGWLAKPVNLKELYVLIKKLAK
ncbi:MAG: response regulator [Candidatus Euphemobacter frigidus]|nr:response regulator [Candidatus Euphemobacter frigidus]MDP8276057.1 response regulator [Candidatus Euphemobacter frigidus]